MSEISRPLLSVRNLTRHYQGRPSLFSRAVPAVRAVNGVSFDLPAGETLGLVGESGSGKSTLGRTVLQLDRASGGQVLFDGTDITVLGDRGLRPFRRRMQMIFQDPHASLNPTMTVGEIIAEPLIVHGLMASRAARRERVAELLDMVHLPVAAASRVPREFSGGQRQRIGIARALSLQPELVVADEAVSALDVSIQAQIINLLIDLQKTQRFALLFIAHDLAVVRQIADRVAVMNGGRIVELAPAEALFADPRHPYTRQLIDAAPIPDPDFERRRSRRTAPRWTSPDSPPALREVAPGHLVAID